MVKIAAAASSTATNQPGLRSVWTVGFGSEMRAELAFVQWYGRRDVSVPLDYGRAIAAALRGVALRGVAWRERVEWLRELGGSRAGVCMRNTRRY